MEKVLSLLKQLTGRISVLASIPTPIKFSLLVAGVAVGVLVIWKKSGLDHSEKVFLVIVIVLLAIITGGYYAWKAWTEKKQKKQFGGEIVQHSSATPRPISDPGQRARLDDLRKKFQSGVEAYKSRGKDLYKLPWYVMVGEPGSGKTEAIRHSNVGFPPGMQDEFQGVGGTINMNWWFTNHAIILDTAGRLIFDDVKPGETSEWREFLTLLKKNRSNCPINGLFLVIPSDSLIKDSSEAIQKKAAKIAQQLGIIQSVLDIRFPVLVLITKCDKINGFREFFDGLTDPERQHQMLGWANREPLDEPFKPDAVGKHLEQVAVRLRRRRLGLLRDPVPENNEGRRADEVDSLYAFPQSLEQLSSRLRQYLETVFTAGEWSPKPLFLRGIFFSSSMREGAALDAELAQAIGVSVEELPEGKVWERERAFFLRDLFLEKVFREKGLVTRASNTKAMLRGQQLAFLGCGFVLLALFLVIAWKAKSKLIASTEKSMLWQVIQANGWTNKTWKAGLVPVTAAGSVGTSLKTNLVEVPDLGTNLTLGEFQVRLRDQTEKPLPSKTIFFPGLPHSYEENRRAAQRIFFDDSVVHPLLEAAWKKMSASSVDAGSAQHQPEALATLIQLESDIIARKAGAAMTEPPEEKSKRFLGSLQKYVTGNDLDVDPNLVSVMSWTYWTNEAGKNYWPPPWCSGARSDTNDLTHNFPINAGIVQMVNNATNDLRRHLAQGQQISTLLQAARSFYLSESTLFANAGPEVDRNKFLAVHNDVLSAAAALKEKAANLETLAGSVSLSNAYKRFEAAVISSTVAPLDLVKTTNRKAMAANKSYALFTDIDARLNSAAMGLTNVVSQLLSATNAADLDKLEAHFDTNGFGKRVVIYALANKQFANEAPFANEGLIGFKGVALETFFRNLNAHGYSGNLTNQFSKVVADYRRRAEKDYFAAYLKEASKQLSSFGRFPLASNTIQIMAPEECKAAAKQLNLMFEDLASPIFHSYVPVDTAENWKSFGSSITNRYKVARALVTSSGELGTCAISLEAKGRGNDEWRSHWHDIKVTSGRDGGFIRTSSDSEREIKVPVQQPIELLLMDNANGPHEIIPVRVAEWAPIRLLLQYRATHVATNTWLVNVEFPVGRQKQNIVVPLKLKFENELPSLDQWPGQ